ncbi:NAD(P)H-dependent glycerol-3-phosphate dehydrogenase [Streptomyces sp. NPDC087850]|uniref:NAD(P)H-dependent glycerol-3-phosphate dehydrogenase n=1 Tax=Streptomyces sp. NPDC087850 TaxID=3365809 RepID=UPI0038222A6C
MAAQVSVLGAGSWGTAVAMTLADAGCKVTLWARRPELAEAINKSGTNPDYFPGQALPTGITATADAETAARSAEIVYLALTAQTLRDNLGRWVPILGPDTVLVSLMKGVELSTSKRMSQVIEEVAGVPAERVAVMSGPNLAREIVARQPAAAVVACVDQTVAQRLQAACHTPYFRPYTSADVVGCELGGAVKNVIALAAGIADGMGLGDNTKAALLTRGLAETTRLGVAMGANPLTFAGLAGMGDLVATCSSSLSRNRVFGVRLGQGMSLSEAAADVKQTAEGVTSCVSVRNLAHQYGVEMPITETVVSVIHDGKAPNSAVKELMTRSTTSEW